MNNVYFYSARCCKIFVLLLYAWPLTHLEEKKSKVFMLNFIWFLWLLKKSKNNLFSWSISILQQKPDLLTCDKYISWHGNLGYIEVRILNLLSSNWIKAKLMVIIIYIYIWWTVVLNYIYDLFCLYVYIYIYKIFTFIYISVHW